MQVREPGDSEMQRCIACRGSGRVTIDEYLELMGAA